MINNLEEWRTIPADEVQNILNISAKGFGEEVLKTITRIIEFCDKHKGELNIGDQLRKVYNLPIEEPVELKPIVGKPKRLNLSIVK